MFDDLNWGKKVSTHSRPKAAGEKSSYKKEDVTVSTHSRPKAAGLVLFNCLICILVFQHTAARRRLEFTTDSANNRDLFQHTAARRRLGQI